MTTNINIIVVGVSGAGKSALCNTVSRTSTFEEGDSSSPVTRQNQQITFDIDEKQATIVDTIGLDDAVLSTTHILQAISQACTQILNGRIHNLFYVIGGRITPGHLQQLDEIQQTIFTPNIRNYTTVIRTKYSGFQSVNATNADETNLREQLPQLFQLCKKMIYVNNHPENVNEQRVASATRLRTYIHQLSNEPPYTETITSSPISLQEQNEARLKAQEEQRIRQERELAELERRRQEDQRRRDEMERRRREQEEANRRHQEQMAKERQAIEEAKRRNASEMASLGAARSTSVPRDYQVQSATGHFYKLSGTGSFHISNNTLHMSGNWNMAQQNSSFGAHLETVVGNVQNLSINGSINITSSLTVPGNLTIG